MATKPPHIAPSASATYTLVTLPAAPWLRALIGPQTRVAVMQNGVDHAERIVEYISADRALPAIIMLPAAASAPGAVEPMIPAAVVKPVVVFTLRKSAVPPAVTLMVNM